MPRTRPPKAVRSILYIHWKLRYYPSNNPMNYLATNVTKKLDHNSSYLLCFFSIPKTPVEVLSVHLYSIIQSVYRYPDLNSSTDSYFTLYMKTHFVIRYHFQSEAGIDNTYTPLFS